MHFLCVRVVLTNLKLKIHFINSRVGILILLSPYYYIFLEPSLKRERIEMSKCFIVFLLYNTFFTIHF